MTDSSDKLIKYEIKSRKVTYYLTSEEDLAGVRNNSLLGDIFSGLASLAAGGIISVTLAKATGIQLGRETIGVLSILFYVFIVITVVFAVLAFHFHRNSFAAIKKIKDSGTVTSLKSGNQEEIVQTTTLMNEMTRKESRLEILKAEYWTLKARLDVTEELRKKVVGNKLEVIASNAIKGDPDKGTVKKLTIEYRFDGISVTKEFKEGDKIVIPYKD